MCGGDSSRTDRKATLTGYGDLESMISQLSKVGTRAAASGEADTGTASKYFRDIVSGDPAKVMAAAAPEVNAIKARATQQKKEVANLGGNRSGGTNAVLQDLKTKTGGQISDVVSGKRGEAAGSLAGVGAGETKAGISASGEAGGLSASLADISGRNRAISKEIHDAAVDQWVSIASDLLLS